jgi:hypothetical protein
MKAYEAAKLLKLSNKEFLEKYGIKSHMSKVPEDLEQELFGDEKKIEEAGQTGTETVDSAETVVVDPVDAVEEDEFPVLNTDETGEICPYSIEEIELGIRCLGGKAPQYKWRHLLNG